MLPDRIYSRIVLSLLAVHALLVASVAWVTPWTTDEPFYFKAGVVLRRHLDWDVFETTLHGPLPFFANQLLADWAVPTDSFAGYLFWGRLGMLPFTLLGGWFLAKLVERAIGRVAAVGALTLYCLDPVILANASLMTCDLAVTGMTLVVLYAAWRYLTTPGVGRLLLLGLSLGLAFGTKYFVFLLLPGLLVALGYETVRGFRPRLLFSRRSDHALARTADLVLVVLVCAALALAVLHTCYLWTVDGYTIRTPVPGITPNPRDPGAGPLSATLQAALALPLVPQLLGLLPDPFVRGLDFQQFVHDAGGSTVLGDHIHAGHPAYFALSFLVKLPLATLVLVALGLFVRRPALAPRLSFLLLASIAIPFTYVSLASTQQMGIRYILPVLPMLHVFGGRAVQSLLRTGAPRPTAGILAVGTCAVALLAFVAGSWPHYTASFNLLAGDRPYLLFSRGTNLCWPYRAEQPEDVIGEHADAYHVRPGEGPRLGKCVTYGSRLGSVDKRDSGRVYHWLRRMVPLDRIGPWLVFDVTDAAFAAAVGEGSDAPDWRGMVELAVARAVTGDLVGAGSCLRDNPDPDAGPARELLAAARAAPQRTDDLARALLEFGRGDVVLTMAAPVSPGLRAQAYLTFQQHYKVIELLTAVEGQRRLALSEAHLLQWAFRSTRQLDQALAVIDRYMPEPGDPLRAMVVLGRRDLEAIRVRDSKYPEIDDSLRR